MATKAKPKSNRAKFTLSKKTEKHKSETVAPKKEKKAEIKEEPQVEAKKIIQEDTVEKPVEADSSTEITHNAQSLSETEAMPQATPPIEKEHTVQNEELATNPFSIDMPTMPEHTDREQHENPFTDPIPVTTDAAHSEHPAQSQSSDKPIQEAISTESPELSSTLPKDDIAPHPSSFSTPVEVETKGKGLIIYFVIVAFIAFLIGIGSMAFFTFGLSKLNGGFHHLGSPQFMAKTTPTTTKSAKTTTPTPQPTKAVDLSAYKIKILNGSGITGAASKLKTELTTDGFTIVNTGNADKSDYSDTIISVKKDISTEYTNKLEDILKKEFTLGQNTQLSDTDAKDADVVITIGSNSAK